jgi:oligopeptide/dipeptide ABC transporter ATP-binding protein
MSEETLLSVRDLRTYLDTPEGVVKAVDGVGFDVRAGRTLALVGESGSGKSMTALSIMQLLPEPAARIVEGSVKLDGRDLLDLTAKQMRELRGKRMGMIFQEPMTSLNPTFTVGYQLLEALKCHGGARRSGLGQEAVKLLQEVEIREPEAVLRKYPHELSGGMRQRVMIAIALANRPSLLIADEPTTALDVTIQAQILRLIKRLQGEHNMGVLLITHDLGVVNETADDVAVMYLGQIVEQGPVDAVLSAPAHPYTQALFASRASREHRGRVLPVIPGNVPGPHDWPPACRFHPRCPFRMDVCEKVTPEVSHLPDRTVRCHFVSPLEEEAKLEH